MEPSDAKEPEVEVDVEPAEPKHPRPLLGHRTVIAVALIAAATALGISGALPAEAVLRLLGLAANTSSAAPSASGAGGENP